MGLLTACSLVSFSTLFPLALEVFPMLTDAECRNATCPAGKKRARLACSGGLYLEVAPSGSKRWFWKYRKDGKEGRMALGSYPDRLVIF